MPAITDDDAARFEKWHQKDLHLNRIAGTCTVIAAILTIVAVAAIFGSGFCLTLPGINALSDIILPVMLPAAGGILISVPLYVATFLTLQKANRNRKKWVGRMYEILEELRPDYSRKKICRFVEKNFINSIWKTKGKSKKRYLDSPWRKEYRSRLVGDVKKSYPKRFPDKADQTEDEKRQQKISKALKRVKEHIAKRPS